MFHKSLTIGVCILCLSMPCIGAAQKPPIPQETMTYHYADIAEKAVAASLVAHIKVRKATKIPAKIAGVIPSGATRYLVQADVISLLRSNAPMPKMIQYIIDLKPDSLGRKQRIAKQSFVVFGSPGRSGEIRLLDADSQLPFSDQMDRMVRNILTEMSSPQAAPKINGIQSGFHTAGTLPGEGESQIFLSTDGERPVSLTIIRQNDKPPRWFVSLGEVVDEAKEPPRRNTLLWYRLACSLPSSLPESVTADIPAATATILKEDYSLVMRSMGVCTKTPKST